MFDHERSLVQKYQGRPFALLGVDEDGSQAALQLAEKKHNLNWRSWWDKDSAIASQWKVRGLPTLFLLDHKGAIRWHQEGVPDLKELDLQIEQLVKAAELEDGKVAALMSHR